jgi:hypothetical protein
MSFQYNAKDFQGPRPQPLLVMIDTTRRHLLQRNHLGRTNIGGIVANCQKAVTRARGIGLHIAFVRDYGDTGSSWIAGLAPQRDDMVFERRSLSCYSANYFREAAARSGALLIAGFPGGGGALRMGIDAMRAGHPTTFLQDALEDGDSKRLLCAPIFEAFAKHPELGLAVTGTHRWFSNQALSEVLGDFGFGHAA